MKHYSISDLERLSGIKAHTIRIWEQRYNALKPKRSAGNTRIYDDSQLRKLLNIVSLSETGRKVSELFDLSEADIHVLLQEEIEKTRQANSQNEYFISQMIIAGLKYDEAGLEKYFTASLVRYGMRNTYLNVIHPMLVRIGLIWGKDELCPAQEHFISNFIIQKIHASADGLPIPSNSKKNWLLFLPEGETHEIGLLFSNYIIRSRSQSTIYLGGNVPFESLKDTVKDVLPTDVLFFIITNYPHAEAQEYIGRIMKICKNIRIHIAGNTNLISKLKLDKTIHWIHSVEELEKYLIK